MQVYPPVYRHKSFEFGEARAAGGQIAQRVHIVDDNGEAWEALYTLEQQPDGSLKIYGVQSPESGPGGLTSAANPDGWSDIVHRSSTSEGGSDTHHLHFDGCDGFGSRDPKKPRQNSHKVFCHCNRASGLRLTRRQWTQLRAQSGRKQK